MWEEIKEFINPNEFERFVEYIEEQVHRRVAVEVPPNTDNDNFVMNGERWFKDIETNEIWRLSYPDFPYKGRWERIKTKLTGSSIEHKYREELMLSHTFLFHDKKGKKISQLLIKHFPKTKTAYIIGQTPEYYTILVNTDIVVVIRINQIELGPDPILETISIFNYRLRLSKSLQTEFAVALELAQKDMN